MKLESQVTSLELSKKLKELGVKQESLFYYAQDPRSGEYELAELLYEDKNIKPSDFFKPLSAFTVAELGEMLPDYTKTEEGYLQLRIMKFKNLWEIAYINRDRLVKAFTEQSEADARAKLLIYLLENKLT